MKKLRVLLLAILACICLYSLYACSLTGGKISEANEYNLSVTYNKDHSNRNVNKQFGKTPNEPVKKITIISPDGEQVVYTKKLGDGQYISDFRDLPIKVGDKVVFSIENYHNEGYQEYADTASGKYIPRETYSWYLDAISINDEDILVDITENNDPNDYGFSFDVLEQDYDIKLIYKPVAVPRAEVFKTTATGDYNLGSNVVTAKIVERAILEDSKYLVKSTENNLPILDTNFVPQNIVFGQTEVREGDVIEYTIAPQNGYISKISYSDLGSDIFVNDANQLVIPETRGQVATEYEAVLIEEQVIDSAGGTLRVRVGKSMPSLSVNLVSGELLTASWMNGNDLFVETSVVKGSAPVAPATNPTKDSPVGSDYEYVFAGWATEEGGEIIAEFDEITVNATFYAVFDKAVDGVVLDGKLDAAYGDFEDEIVLTSGGTYGVSAVKTEKGVIIYAQGIFNSSVTNANWYDSTNFEFKLNKGTTEQSYFAKGNNKSADITHFHSMIVEQIDSQYIHTVEFFVPSSNIPNWSADAEIQLNYAWKAPGERDYIKSSTVDRFKYEWEVNGFYAWHRLGGLQDMPANLFISEDGLTTIEAPTGNDTPVIDGDISEYGISNYSYGTSPKPIVTVNGKVVDGDLYLALKIQHNSSLTYNKFWYLSDNLELKINGLHTAIMFVEDKLILPADIHQGAMQTSTEGTNKIITAEIYIKGDVYNYSTYKVKIGSAGVGFGAGASNNWQDIVWGHNELFISEDGVVETAPATNGVVLDGNISDWATNTAYEINATPNDTTVNVKAKKLNQGVVFGVTINHKNTIDSVNGTVEGQTYSDWYHYLNLEFRINNISIQQYVSLMNGNTTTDILFAGIKSTGAEGNITTVLEIFVYYRDIGLLPGQDVQFAMGGVFDGKFDRLTGDWNDDNNWVLSNHKVTANGIQAVS